MEPGVFLRVSQTEKFAIYDPQLVVLQEGMEEIRKRLEVEIEGVGWWRICKYGIEEELGEDVVPVVEIKATGERVRRGSLRRMGCGVVEECEEEEGGAWARAVEVADEEMGKMKLGKAEERLRRFERKVEAWTASVMAFGSQLERICEDVGYWKDYLEIVGS